MMRLLRVNENVKCIFLMAKDLYHRFTQATITMALVIAVDFILWLWSPHGKQYLLVGGRVQCFIHLTLLTSHLTIERIKRLAVIISWRDNKKLEQEMKVKRSSDSGGFQQEKILNDLMDKTQK